MDVPGENWLSDEKFDFYLNLSKSSVEEVSVDGLDDEEEVFMGPVSHKEKCMSVLVQEKEDIKISQRPNPQEQALLLRESALINLRIKSQGTPAGRRNPMMSPVAVVHPMKRQDITNEFISPITIGEENKENIPKNNTEIDDSNATPQNVLLSKQSNSIIPQSENPVKMRMSSARSSKKGSNRLSMPNKPSRYVTEFAEPLPLPLDDQNTSVSGGGRNKLGNNEQQKRLRKPSTIPKPGSITKSKSGGGIPSLLPSVLPTRPKQFVGNSSIKPLKSSTQSVSGIAQQQHKLSSQVVFGIAQPHLKMSARKCISEGTPASKKLQVNSSKKQSLGGKKHPASNSTPSASNGSKVLYKPPEKSEAKQDDLITPVVKSSRKSIIGRKLNPDDKTSRSPSPDRLKQSNHSDMQEKESLDNAKLVKKGYTHVPPETQEDEIPSHNDILQKYKKICNTETYLSLSTNKMEKINSEIKGNIGNEFVLQENDLNMKNKIANGNEGIAIIPLSVASSNDAVNSHENEFSITNSTNTVNSKEIDLPTVQSPAPLLIDIFDCMESEISPVKLNSIDPFETGNTPPPLIQLDVVLEPERQPEVNLINF